MSGCAAVEAKSGSSEFSETIRIMKQSPCLLLCRDWLLLDNKKDLISYSNNFTKV
jgi:hypothetical protein